MKRRRRMKRRRMKRRRAIWFLLSLRQLGSRTCVRASLNTPQAKRRNLGDAERKTERERATL